MIWLGVVVWLAAVLACVGAFAIHETLVTRPRQVKSESDVRLAEGAGVRVIFPKYPDVEVYGIVADSADLPARHRRVTIPAVGLTLRFPTADLRIVDDEIVG